jgi:hypothetical protein
MNYLQQGGLASPVVPHQTDAVAVASHEGNVAKQEVAREIYRQFIQLDHLSQSFLKAVAQKRFPHTTGFKNSVQKYNKKGDAEAITLSLFIAKFERFYY